MIVPKAVDSCVKGIWISILLLCIDVHSFSHRVFDFHDCTSHLKTLHVSDLDEDFSLLSKKKRKKKTINMSELTAALPVSKRLQVLKSAFRKLVY